MEERKSGNSLNSYIQYIRGTYKKKDLWIIGCRLNIFVIYSYYQP